MGYYTRFDGEIRIEPPLTWAEIKRGPGLQDIRLRTVEDTQETDEGRITRVTADAVTPLMEDSYKGYSIVEELQSLVDAHGKNHRFVGYISAEGEEAGDLWRLAVKNGKAVKIEPRIVWPDEA
jgi:hypothetical protein